MHSFLLFLITLMRVLPLEGDTHHVQGMAIDDGKLYLTSVDRAARKGFLFEYDVATGQRLRAVELQTGELYHAGGMDQDDDSLWIPVAEYRPESRTVVQRRSKQTLEMVASFEVPDHIGALAVVPEGLLMANWDSRRFYLYTREGRPVWSRPNPNVTRYQDLKRRYGAILASGLRGRGSAAAAVIEWLDPATLRPLQSETLGQTDRGVPYTNEAMDYRDGLLYLVPEDSPSRLFVFRMES